MLFQIFVQKLSSFNSKKNFSIYILFSKILNIFFYELNKIYKLHTFQPHSFSSSAFSSFYLAFSSFSFFFNFKYLSSCISNTN